MGCLAQLGEHRPYKARVVGSIPTAPTNNGVVVQLVRIPACHAGGRGFEPRPLRQINAPKGAFFLPACGTIRPHQAYFFQNGSLDMLQKLNERIQGVVAWFVKG